MDDVLLFGVGTKEILKELAALIEKYKKAARMLVNIENSLLVHNECSEYLIQQSKEILSYPINPMSNGFKYLGFFLKPNSYGFQDWIWIYHKVEARVSAWENNFISRGGRLLLIKVVFHCIPV